MPVAADVLAGTRVRIYGDCRFSFVGCLDVARSADSRQCSAGSAMREQRSRNAHHESFAS
jgi:hypothetical protein